MMGLQNKKNVSKIRACMYVCMYVMQMHVQTHRDAQDTRLRKDRERFQNMLYTPTEVML